MQNKSPTRHLQASLRASACVVVITAQAEALRDGTHAYYKLSGNAGQLMTETRLGKW